MKSTIVDLARKWWVGVCLLLWSWLTYAAICVPAMLILFSGYLGVPLRLTEVLLVIYVVVCVPFVAYRVGREFVHQHEKICGEKNLESDHAA
jgi:hypothetical protein